MKKIMIATDFSEPARHAARYGCKLAEKLGAEVILFHSFLAPVPTPHSTLITITYEEVKKAQEELLRSEAALLDPGERLIKDRILVEGVADEEIPQAMKDVHADLLVLGYRGAGAVSRFLLGSTATALCRKADFPLLVVPGDAETNDIKSITFASDTDTTMDIHLLDPMKEIAKAYSAVVYILKVMDNEDDAAIELLTRPTRWDRYLEEIGATWNFRVDDDVVHGINTFAKEYHADLMVMVPHRHNLLERLFLGSHAREMIHQARVPLLLLPFKAKNEEAAAKETNPARQEPPHGKTTSL